jgi:hypothetical protein
VYGLLASRVVQELKLVPLVFDVLGLKKTRAEALALLELLQVIHETRCPTPAPDLDLLGKTHG